MSDQNPKQAGTPIIDCIPQTGECPVGCKECFYNGGRFYRTLDHALIPSGEEAKGKIVRVNSGNDSNVERDFVIEVTKPYQDKFYNTAIPKFGFPGPTIFIANGKSPFFINKCKGKDLMAVRVRYSSWGLSEQIRLVDYYTCLGIPVLVTWMRYYDVKGIPPEEQRYYEWRQSTTNKYFIMLPETKRRLMDIFKGRPDVYSCSPLWSSYCTNCGVCEMLYRRWKAEYLVDGFTKEDIEELDRLDNLPEGPTHARDRGFSID
jgi:hypothetical protein